MRFLTKSGAFRTMDAASKGVKRVNEPIIGTAVLRRYPDVDEAVVDALLQRELAASGRKLVVLDDDPTGVQTVHDVSVYTDWSPESIRQGFAETNRLFYILTNSRSFTAEQTAAAHREIARNVAEAAREAGTPYLLISRCDSTLRGHYPLETETLRRETEKAGGPVMDGEVLCPYFKEGGRFTIDNVHYVRYGGELVPAGDTEFARDATFGYRSSDLREYIEEKTAGAYPADTVCCVTLGALRRMDIDGVCEQLMAAHGFGKIVVNAVDDCDLKVFCVALYRAIARGKEFLFRSAAGLVKILGGVSDRPLLTGPELLARETRNGGVVIVGSHTRKTTEQLDALLALPDAVGVAFRSELVLDGDGAFDAEINRSVAEIEAALRSGRTAVCYTNRTLLRVEGESGEDALRRSVKISEGVCALVERLRVTPAFVVAKGGITSSDVGVKALRVRRADVLGQIRPGIPVWRLGPESKFPDIPYVIFPGNTGEADTLRRTVEILRSGMPGH